MKYLFISIIVYFLIPRVHHEVYVEQPLKIEEPDDLTVDLLSKLIASECVPGDLTDMRMIGEVVRNRVESENYPNTYLGVISESNAFHGYKTDRFYSPDDNHRRAAYTVLEGHRLLPCDIYHYVNPKTASNTKWLNKLINEGERVAINIHKRLPRFQHHYYRITDSSN